jgi:hypothetical protein
VWVAGNVTDLAAQINADLVAEDTRRAVALVRAGW